MFEAEIVTVCQESQKCHLMLIFITALWYNVYTLKFSCFKCTVQQFQCIQSCVMSSFQNISITLALFFKQPINKITSNSSNRHTWYSALWSPGGWVTIQGDDHACVKAMLECHLHSFMNTSILGYSSPNCALAGKTKVHKLCKTIFSTVHEKNVN